MGTVLVTGGTGFVGSRLAHRLSGEGHEVRVMTRHPDTYTGPGKAVYGDVAEPASLNEALHGIDLAYYLIHSLDADEFEKRDADAAWAFGEASALQGVDRIVYLGGLGAEDDELSPHLRSRRQVEGLLGSGGVAVTVLRAAVVVGHGGASWEITRQLVENLPAMVVPQWAHTLTQPIGVDDVIRYLVDVAGDDRARGQTYEIGGVDQLSYLDMVQIASEEQSGKTVPVLSVPLIPSALSAFGLSMITDVDSTTTKNLIDSMGVEVLVSEHSIAEISPAVPAGYREQVRRALRERAEDQEKSSGRA